MHLRQSRSEVRGLIAHYRLVDWWLSSFTEEERDLIDERYQPMGMPSHALTQGGYTSSQPAPEFLNGLASWFRSKQESSIFERIHSKIAELGREYPVAGPGYYNGRHYTTYVYDVESLRRQGLLEKVEELLIGLIVATEAEDQVDKRGVAPWYYEELAKIYRKQKDYAREVRILERFANQRHAPGAKPLKLMERLVKARALLDSAADELRANSKLKSSEYSVPVLGLVFLRYADHKFQAAAKELEGTGGGRRTIGPADYQARGVLYLPEAARFSTLIRLPEGANIGAAINDAMRAIEAENPDLKDVLPKTYNRFENALLKELLKTMNSIPMDIEGDAFGKIYEYFLGQFAMSEGQKGGEFFTPTAIVQLIVEIIEPFHGRIFDPACGSGGMFVQSARFVEEHKKNPGAELSHLRPGAVAETVRLAKMNLAVHGLAGDIRQGNTYYEDLHRSSAGSTSSWPIRPSTWTGGQGAAQGRPALPLRPAPHRQRQLPLDPDLSTARSTTPAGPGSSWPTPPPTPAAPSWRSASSSSKTAPWT
jgi:hypothetical protein